MQKCSYPLYMNVFDKLAILNKRVLDTYAHVYFHIILKPSIQTFTLHSTITNKCIIIHSYYTVPNGHPDI